MSKSKTVKMKFSADQFYGVAVNGNVTGSLSVPLYRKDKVYEVDEKMAPRWLKRGGEIVEDEAPAKVEDKVEEKVDAPAPQAEVPVEPAPEKEEDVEKSAPQKAQGNKPAHKQGNGNKR